MKPEELRIGNLTYRKEISKGKLVRIVRKVTADILSSEHELEWTEPIPLTEERLEKFGFEKGNRFTGYTKWRHPSGFVVMVNEIDKEFKISAQGRLKKIEYVHALQNCFYYFALTGEELKVNETVTAT